MQFFKSEFELLKNENNWIRIDFFASNQLFINLRLAKKICTNKIKSSSPIEWFWLVDLYLFLSPRLLGRWGDTRMDGLGFEPDTLLLLLAIRVVVGSVPFCLSGRKRWSRADRKPSPIKLDYYYPHMLEAQKIQARSSSKLVNANWRARAQLPKLMQGSISSWNERALSFRASSASPAIRPNLESSWGRQLISDSWGKCSWLKLASIKIRRGLFGELSRQTKCWGTTVSQTLPIGQKSKHRCAHPIDRSAWSNYFIFLFFRILEFFAPKNWFQNILLKTDSTMDGGFLFLIF